MMGNYHIRCQWGGGGGIALKGNTKITPIQPHFVAQNPLLVKQLFVYAILGFLLIKAIALFALKMVFLILFDF